MNKLFFPLFILLFIGCAKHHPTNETKFQGLWKLERYEYPDKKTGTWFPDTIRTGYTGVIIYDGNGHMSVQITPEKFNNLNGQTDFEALTCDSLRYIIDLYSSNYSYFANYSISENLIEHTVISASDPGLCNKVLKRNFEFSADTLYLIPVVGDSVQKTRLKWIKAK